MSTKTPILIHSWHEPDSCGGFDWYPAESIESARMQYDHDVETGDWAHVILLEIAVPSEFVIDANPDLRSTLTDYIDAELLDLIESAQIGRIIARYSREAVTA